MKKISSIIIIIMAIFILAAVPVKVKADPFLSEIRATSFSFAPKGWALCEGQLLPINQNQALFSLLGTTYGGDGRVNFALPDLRGRVIIHEGNGHTLGERGGEETHALTISEMPAHSHSGTVSAVDSSLPVATATIIASNKEGNTADPTGALPAEQKAGPNLVKAYVIDGSTGPINIKDTTELTTYNMKTMKGSTILISLPVNTLGNAGGSQSFNTMQPYLTVNYMIALQGIYPSSN